MDLKFQPIFWETISTKLNGLFFDELKWNGPFVFVDINANDGQLSRILSAQYETSKVISVSDKESILKINNETEYRNRISTIKSKSKDLIQDGSILIIQGFPGWGNITDRNFLRGQPYEQLFENYRQCSAIILIVSKDYLFQRVRNYMWYHVDIDNQYRMIIAIT